MVKPSCDEQRFLEAPNDSGSGLLPGGLGYHRRTSRARYDSLIAENRMIVHLRRQPGVDVPVRRIPRGPNGT
jgi:hypothetical protein